MGNAFFRFGSSILDYFGFGRSSSKLIDAPGESDTDTDDDDRIDKHERAKKNVEEMEEYCKPLLFVNFKGQASSNTDTDSNLMADTCNIGVSIHKLDALIRQYRKIENFTVKDVEFQALLQKIAEKRHRDEEDEQRCLRRLKRDAKRFEIIYKERAARNPNSPIFSEELETVEYWGTRQQLLAGKVICDWLSSDDEPPMDPIFGVLLNPTAGRVGPGDSGWVHSLLYDDCGEWAHHAAVHDAFGYLFNFHKVGPGYNYMFKSFFDKDNPLAGQISGIDFWKRYVSEVETKLKVISNFKDI